MKTIYDYLSKISDNSEKEAVLINASVRYPRLIEAYLRRGEGFSRRNEELFVEKASVEALELFAMKGNETYFDNDEAFRERISPEVLKIYDGETELTIDEQEALNLPEDFLDEEELGILKKIAEGNYEED